MAEKIKNNPRSLEVAKAAIKAIGSIPKTEPIRGGTDGAQLTVMGILCPNLGSGGHNCHSKFECITLEEMEKCTNVLINIVKQAYKK